jgi:hypothetical protein
MEWIMMLVRSSYGGSSIKHNAAGIIKEKGRDEVWNWNGDKG